MRAREAHRLLCFHVTVLKDGRSGRRQPTGWMRRSTAHPTSWLAVDGSERVGVGRRNTADLVEIVTIYQIWAT